MDFSVEVADGEEFIMEMVRRNRWVRFGKRTHREAFLEGLFIEKWFD
jgi:hypothetical protein